MKKMLRYTAAASLFWSTVTLAANPAQQQAEILLDQMQMGQLMEQSIDQMLQVQLQQQPALVPFKQVMRTFLQKHMSYAQLKDEFVNIYAEAFTADELKQLNAFYATPVGQKTIQKMPELMAKGAQLGAQQVQDNMAELQQMIQEEAKRIEELQAKGK